MLFSAVKKTVDSFFTREQWLETIEKIKVFIELLKTKEFKVTKKQSSADDEGGDLEAFIQSSDT